MEIGDGRRQRMTYEYRRGTGEGARASAASAGPAAAAATGQPLLLASRRARSRRGFLTGTLALGAAALVPAIGVARAAPAGERGPAGGAPARAFKISLAQWSLHRELRAARLDPLDFAKFANGLGIDAVEYVSEFYRAKVRSKPFLAELKRRAAGEGVGSLLIAVDDEGDLGARDPRARRRALEAHKKWVDAAAFLGCHAIRVSVCNSKAAGNAHEDDLANWASEGLRKLAELSGARGVDVLVENGGGVTSRGSWLSEVLNAVNHPRCGSLPDFGGFDLPGGEGHDRYKGVRELMPFARAVNARARDFDERGEETKIKFGQMLEIVTAAGYHGYVGIKYDGERLSERAGIERTKALLERAREQLGARAERRG
jgi:sugar phosphate isomerase/epimerase